MRLHEAGVDNPALCSRILVCEAARLDKTQLILNAQEEMESGAAERLRRMTERRAAGEPIAYILGKKEFFGLDFHVDPSTLIPRPETEHLVEAALERIGEGCITFADAGCGSGCIGLALLYHRPGWRGILFDISPAALNVAHVNSHSLHCESFLLQANIFSPPFGPRSLDLFISNPPYISNGEKALVMRECLDFEPHSALFSLENGLAHLRAAIMAAAFALRPGGWIMLEHGWNQARQVADFLGKSGFCNIFCQKDLSGLDRCAIAQKG